MVGERGFELEPGEKYIYCLTFNSVFRIFDSPKAGSYQ
jgi:hypothetical protein